MNSTILTGHQSLNNKILYIAGVIAACVCGGPLSAQDTEPADSLVRLMSASSVQMIQKENENIRKVIGPARFLHNDTYFLCDTAYWYVDDEIIKAWGNVSLMQENTVLTSDRLDYLIPEDLAQFRGLLVELRDKDGNLLRTKHLDYNTKDSVAVFQGGASMRDSEGQIIESIKGTYDSKAELFTFEKDVNMFSDSIFVKTDLLLYHTVTDKADFNAPLDAWKDDNMLSAGRGEYDREAEVFRFFDDVHLQGPSKEAWSDTLYFERTTNNIEMRGSVQITDEERHVTGLGRFLYYEDSLSMVTLRDDAAAVMEVTSGEEDNRQTDTLYAGADRLVYRSIRMCDIEEEEIAEATRRRGDMQVDPVSQYREKAAEEAARKAEEARKAADERSGKAAAEKRSGSKSAGETQGEKPVDAVAAGEDSAENVPAEEAAEENVPVEEAPAATPPPEDVPAPGEPPAEVPVEAPGEVPVEAPAEAPVEAPAEVPVEVPEAAPDTTKVGFVWAVGDVRVYKSDMQARCDSLVFMDLDSLARMYVEPVIWNEGTRQYVADSVMLMVADGRMRKANLMSGAFIVIQEDSTLFDQISSTEMMAYFDSTTVLERFDALGGAQAVFYIEENDALATVNKVNTKMLSAYFKDGDIDRIYYFESPKSDAYPTVQLPGEDRRMKGFRWTPENRPGGREDVTALEPRGSQRSEYDARPRAAFRQSDIYFPGYLSGIYREIAVRDSLARIAPPQEELTPADGAAAPADTAELAVAPADLSQASDSLSLREAEPVGTGVQEDSTWVDLDEAIKQLQESRPEPTKSELRRQAREERWAEKDARDAARAEAKAARALEKERARKRKLLAAQQRQAEKDARTLERYKARYEKKLARSLSKKSSKQ